MAFWCSISDFDGALQLIVTVPKLGGWVGARHRTLYTVPTQRIALHRASCLMGTGGWGRREREWGTQWPGFHTVMGVLRVLRAAPLPGLPHRAGALIVHAPFRSLGGVAECRCQGLGWAGLQAPDIKAYKDARKPRSLYIGVGLKRVDPPRGGGGVGRCATCGRQGSGICGRGPVPGAPEPRPGRA